MSSSNPKEKPRKANLSLARKFEENFDSDDESDEEEQDKGPLSQRVAASITHVAYMTKVFAKLNGKDISRRKGTYCLGVCSCILVVIITALMMTTLGYLPVLFLRLGELDFGETDLVLTPGGEVSEAASLNYSIVKNLFPSGPRSYHTGRIEWDASLVKSFTSTQCGFAAASSTDTTPVDVSKLWEPVSGSSFDATCSRRTGCIKQHCTGSGKSTSVIFVNVDQEERMGLGRAWPASVKPNKTHCVLSSAFAAALGAKVGDHVIFDVSDVAQSLLHAYKEAGLDRLNIFFGGHSEFRQAILSQIVGDIVDEGFGKFPDDFLNFALLNYDDVASNTAAALTPEIADYRRDAFAATSPDAMAGEVIFNFPADARSTNYGHSDNADVQTDAIAFASPIIATLGFNQLSVDMPIVTYMFDSRFFALFLGLILSIIIVGLSCLSIILIYSLLVVGVDTKTFELAVMRMVGMTRLNVVCYVLTSAMAFAIPAWIIGLILSQLLFLLVRNALSSALGVTVPLWLTGSAIGYATLAAIGIPLVSAIAPMMDVLAQQLPTALDTSRSKVKTIHYQISRGSEFGVDWLLVGLGSALVVFGFLIYYLFPLALLTFNITLLFYIFFGMLLGMLFGFVLLAVNFERIIETVVQYLFFFWEADAVFVLIARNMTAHRQRNRKTTLMYSMALGFIIFVTVAFQIQLASVKFSIRRGMGADIEIRRDGTTMSYQNMVDLDRILLEEAAHHEGFTYRTVRSTWQPTVGNTTMQTMGRLVTATTRMVGIPPDFFDHTDNDFLRISKQERSGFSMAENLYTVSGSGKGLIGGTFENTMALDLGRRFVMETYNENINNTDPVRRVMEPSALINLAPILRFSKFPQFIRQNAAMSIPQYLRRTYSLDSVRQALFDTVNVKVGNKDETAKLTNILRRRIVAEVGEGIEVEDYYEEIDSLEVAEQIVGFFFIFTQVMSMVICFFSLMSSMAANIQEQAKEIGVLRAIGMRTFPLKRLYVEEAFVVVVSSSFMGVIVGVGVAYTMLIQRALFTQLPLPFIFPWIQLVIVCGAAVFGALISSYGPITAMLNSPSIPHILRRML